MHFRCKSFIKNLQKKQKTLQNKTRFHSILTSMQWTWPGAFPSAISCSCDYFLPSLALMTVAFYSCTLAEDNDPPQLGSMLWSIVIGQQLEPVAVLQLGNSYLALSKKYTLPLTSAKINIYFF